MITVTSGVERWAGDCIERAENDSTAVDAAVVGEHEACEGKDVQLGYDPFPKQMEFHASPAKYRLFGGSAGPGKSKALLMEAILQANDYPGANTLLLRRTFSELEQSLLLYFRRDVPRELYKSFQESKHVVTWWNGATTWFGYCQNESDVYQYQGAEFLFIGIDELTLFTLRQWQFLTSRNRCPLAGAFPCMAGATNPGNIGHAWVKALWIDRRPAPGMECPEEYDPADYDFIPARVSDNPIYASDENYLKTLRALPSHLKRAFLDGDWEVFAGQYFDRFDWTQHVRRAEEVDWKAWWFRWISVDWGFEHPAAVYWHAQGQWEAAKHGDIAGGREARNAGREVALCGPEKRPSARDDNEKNSNSKVSDNSNGDNTSTGKCGAGSGETLGDGAREGRDNPAHKGVVTYREYVTHRTPPRELAREIVARSVERSTERDDSRERGRYDPYGRDGNSPRYEREKIDAIYLSPDAFARRTDEASIAEQMGDVFVAAGLPRPIPADDDRVGGWMLMYQMLDAGEWLLTENCIELIRTLPNLVRDPARIEDVE